MTRISDLLGAQLEALRASHERSDARLRELLADPRELALHDLTLADLAGALGRQSHSRPTGELRNASGRQQIRATGEFGSLEEIRSTAVAARPGGTATPFSQSRARGTSMPRHSLSRSATGCRE